MIYNEVVHQVVVFASNFHISHIILVLGACQVQLVACGLPLRGPRLCLVSWRLGA
jgi:hypothetical protein